MLWQGMRSGGEVAQLEVLAMAAVIGALGAAFLVAGCCVLERRRWRR